MANKNKSLKVIENSKINQTFSHAYLFFGEPGVDTFEVALESIKLMICNSEKCFKAKNINELNYPDLIVINPDKNLITKSDIITIIKDMSNTSLVKENKKILVIKDVDLGNKSSLNSLLKYLEDPSKNVYIIMTTNRINFLISTIKSRAQNVLVKRKTMNEIINNLIERNVNEKYLRLFANVFPNSAKLDLVDIDKFDIIYKKLFSSLKLGLTNPQKMKLEFSNHISKEDVLYVISILEYFYFQIQTVIEEHYPLFPEYNSLINKYKKNAYNYANILHEISVFKKAITNKGNFNLQKENFLLKLINIYEG